MKTYEAASLVELGSASDLVFGIDGQGPDNPDMWYQEGATIADVDE